MSNMEQLRNIRKYKKRRRVVSRIGGFIALVGFTLMIAVSGEGNISLMTIFLVGLTGCGLFGLGISIMNFIDRLNEERPLVYKPVYQGDDLWYNMYINFKKRSELQ